ncbi:MAG: RAMP superfamily CRISPR-associated protein [Oscillochloridaceae bacterium umkhey_bin13]
MSTWQQSRQISTRLVLIGALELTTPAHLGNGEHDNGVDMVLQRDPLKGHPLLPGTSLAGALRAYLQAYEYGDRIAEDKDQRNALAQTLFGGSKGDPLGNQSPLIVDDAFATQPFSENRDDVRTNGKRRLLTEIRDGVGIDPKTRTARPKVKYDLELLPAGTIFPLRFELLLGKNTEALGQALALALQGLEQGAIALGARRSRGFGRCRVTGWQLVRYDLRTRKGLLDWLQAEPDLYAVPTDPRPIAELLTLPSQVDRRNQARLTAHFRLASPLLIRAEQPLRDQDGKPLSGSNHPDVIQIVNAAGQPVLPGTSLAGALRARAERILRTFHPDDRVKDRLEGLFGWTLDREQAKPQKGQTKPQTTSSRLLVEEARITQARTLVQNRVSLDRFTGGAYDTALFSEAPCVAGEVTTVITIINPQEHDVGLLLLLLKDLWTGDLPLGGSASVGRGRLEGIEATLTYQGETWHIQATAEQRLQITGDRAKLEQYVAKVVQAGALS